MHELSIAVNIIEIVEQNARQEKAESVNKIEIEAGQFSGVVIEALEMALQQAKQNTLAENAICEIIELKGKLKCLNCNNIFEAEYIYSVCPSCGSYVSDIIQGNELRVISIEID